MTLNSIRKNAIMEIIQATSQDAYGWLRMAETPIAENRPLNNLKPLWRLGVPSHVGTQTFGLTTPGLEMENRSDV